MLSFRHQKFWFLLYLSRERDLEAVIKCLGEDITSEICLRVCVCRCSVRQNDGLMRSFRLLYFERLDHHYSS